MPSSYFSSNNKTHCAGCSACAHACSHKAIKMLEDQEGFLFPYIDKEKCVNCGICERICPFNGNSQDNPTNEEQTCYIATTRHQEYYQKSATIGVCTMLSQHVIEAGGYVFGVTLDEDDWKAKHICVKTTSELDKIRNSKYIQSDCGTTFQEVRRLLEDKQLVLFSGTPCQIAGLKAYLRKPYNTLLTVDLICHGIYSYKLLCKEVEYWENRLHGKIHNFRFRSKNGSGGIINFDLSDKRGKRSHYEFAGKYSPTYRCYAYSGDGKNYNLRLSCYSCPFRSPKRNSDITIGDAWFIDAAKILNRNLEWKNGVSLIIGNTEKGKQYIDLVKPLLDCAKVTSETAFVQPALLPTNRTIPEIREKLYNSINTEEDYAHIVKRLLHTDIEKLYQNDQRMAKKQRLKNRVKKLLLINKFQNLRKKLYPGWEWWFTNSFLYNFPSKRFRNYQLKKMGMTFKGEARIYAGFHIRNPKGIVLEDGVSIGPRVLLDGRKGLTIKEGAVIGYGAIIWTLNHDYNDLHFCGKGAPVTIGKHAWICSNSIILPGITIGEGAVVASGAIVTHDVAPYTVVGGIPAKIIGEREKKEYDYGYKTVTDHYHFC